MSNTVIQLKSSGVPSHIPNSLSNGEIALNYADGKFYYKNVTGQIVSFSGSGNVYSFATINANNSLITALSNSSVLSIVPGQNIGITSDIINDIITISANLKPAFDIANVAFDYANTLSGGLNFTDISNRANLALDGANAAFDIAAAAYFAANSVYDVANAAFESANNVAPQVAPAFNTANAAFDKANSANSLAYNTGIGANGYTVSVGAAGNAYANLVGTSANSYTDTSTNAANNYSGQMANSSNSYARTFANTVGVNANTWANTVGASGNAYANLIGTSGNSYTDLSTASSNNHSGAMVNSANAYASATYFPYAGGTVTGDVSVSGNLTVKGTTLYANVQKLLVGDNTIVLNAELPSGSAPLGVNSGLSINRGTSSNTYLVWDESATKWAFTNDGSKELYIASNTDIESSNNYSGQMANSANGYATTVGISGNVYANLIGTSGNSYTNLSTSSANNYAGYLSNTVYGYVNTSMTIANAAFDNSNTSYNLTNATYTAVNSAFGVINTAFTTANNALANNSGSVFNGDLIITGSVTVGSSKLTNFTLTTSSNNDQILDHFQTTSYRSAHYTITIDAGVEWETTQISLIHNSTDTFITEYGLLYTSNILATFSASVTLGEVRLNVVPKYASSTIRVLRTTLDD